MLFLLVILQAAYWCDKKNKFGTPIKNSQQLLDRISKSPNISLKKNGSTCLHDAIRSLDCKNVEIVFHRINDDIKTGKNFEYKDKFPDSPGRTGWTPLGLSIELNNEAIFDFLLAQKGRFDYEKHTFDNKNVGNKFTALLLALDKDNVSMAKSLLDQHDIDVRGRHPQTGFTSLHLVSQCNFKGLVEPLVKKFIDTGNQDYFFQKNYQGKIPLAVAAQCNNKEAFDVQFKEIEQKWPDKVREVLDLDKSPSLLALAYLPVPSSSSWTFSDLIISLIPDDDEILKTKHTFHPFSSYY